VWLQNPKSYIPIDRKKVIADCCALLQPSRELRKKLMEHAKKLLNGDKITREQYIDLTSGLAAKNLLMKKTMGDPDEFTDKTLIEIEEEIKAEAREEGRKEKEPEIERLTDDNKELEQHNKSLKGEVESHKPYKDFFEAQCKKSAKNRTRAFLILAVILIISSIIPQVFSLDWIWRVPLVILSIALTLFTAYFGKGLKTESRRLYKWIYNKKLKELPNGKSAYKQ
jgi:hypothetical protein